MRVDDRFPFRLGTHVREPDGRHVAIITSIISDTMHVKFLDTGWRAEFRLGEVVKATEADEYWTW